MRGLGMRNVERIALISQMLAIDQGYSSYKWVINVGEGGLTARRG